MQVFRTIAELRQAVREQRRTGKTIGLVPTMGALHEGHLSLVREGLKRVDLVIGTIFVNPTQFAPHEDFAAYPRMQEEDIRKFESAGAYGAFCPDAKEMYPQGFSSSVQVKGVSEPLEGESRPHFFGGVATVVTKLLMQAQPDVALFGEKDYQQLQVIKRMVMDLDMPVEIIGVETVRDENGLALSSRNAYLSAEQRVIANALNRILFAVAEASAKGGDIATIRQDGLRRMEEAGFDSVDYLEVRNANTLAPVQDSGEPMRVLAAVRLGGTRLIDNVPVRVI